MRIVLVTTGSLGDVKPFLALGLGLREAGYTVRLAGPGNAARLCEQHGVEFYPIDADQQERLSAGAQTAGRLETGNSVRFGLERIRAKQRIFRAVNRAAWLACQGAQGVIYRIGGFLQADSIAERLGAVCFKAGLVPYTATGDFPSLYVYRGRDWGKAGNRLSYWVGEQAVWQFFRRSINEYRVRDLGLKPYPFGGPGKGQFSRRLAVIYGFSPTLLPRPADWPAQAVITGQWALDEAHDWQAPQALLDFLRGGSPPVYIGFGSMVSQDPQQTAAIVLEALRICGQRAVIASGWGGLASQDGLSERIYALDYAPHDWLFPKMAAVVHHGGIGTLTAGLKAGVPTVVVPFNYDQPFWGAQAARLGVGPTPIARPRLTPEGLAGAIAACLEEPAYRQNAAELGRRMQAEDGIRVAVEVIHQQMQ